MGSQHFGRFFWLGFNMAYGFKVSGFVFKEWPSSRVSGAWAEGVGFRHRG